MYSITDVLTNIEQHLPWVMLWTVIAWGGGFVQMLESIRLSVRDRMPGVPLGMAVFQLAHDSTFFMRYDYWLHTVNHWYFSIFWVGMGVSVFIELFLIYCILRDGRKQWAPHLSLRTFLMLIGIFQAATYLLLWWLQSLLDDPLYLVSMLGTQVAAVMFNIPMLLIRGNTKGQSRIYAWAILLGPGSLALGLFPALSPIFHTELFAGVCLTLVALSIAYVVLLEQYRRAEQVPGA